MAWTVEMHPAFEAEFHQLSETVQDAIASRALLLMRTGPALGRPFCDTLHGSGHANMKELRFNAEGGVWRVAFAFDLERKAIILAAGDKAGAHQGRFYKRLIRIADQRFSDHLKGQEGR
ncbi:addiction module toxin RelE [Alkalicaulis satelles]|uniref:Addiction module toxin RelE n=1 Tax=Alkalicaulis satelles TaxID=2609175 RepID=A0A5M6ZDG9_9PROT|nr:type II toxin-antitoxin system RelE/ParE family toxin [Alkalicaulis satelles]KAA5802260.1 addiction module toxin RelE [Alkalicaulis satelles]